MEHSSDLRASRIQSWSLPFHRASGLAPYINEHSILTTDERLAVRLKSFGMPGDQRMEIDRKNGKMAKEHGEGIPKYFHNFMIGPNCFLGTLPEDPRPLGATANLAKGKP